MSLKDIIKEIRDIREADEREERIKSVLNYQAIINYGDIFNKDEEVNVTFFVTLKSGEQVKVDGIFIPRYPRFIS